MLRYPMRRWVRSSTYSFGRTSVDVVKTGGFKVSALEIEEVLRTHPAIADCAVVGVSDEEWGELPHGFVSLHAGKSASSDELVAFCRERLSHYKCPRAVDILEDLPKNGLGKILKSDLRSRFWSGHSRKVN